MTVPPSPARARVSIIVSCFNYERYVGEAIRSALAQTDDWTELIVVDDGSTDRSANVIAAFGDRLTAIFKANGGQASALNAGFRACRGESVIFLDADDVLLPHAASAVARALGGGEPAKAHWSMPVIDAAGKRTGAIQDPELAEGDLRRHAIRHGPLSDMTLPSPPMSGNAFARAFLERVMPIPHEPYRAGADEYLFGLAPAFGPIARVPPQSLYRIHGANHHIKQSFESMLAFQERHHAIVSRVVAQACAREHGDHDEAEWVRSSWWLRAGRAVRAIEAVVPVGAGFAVLDDGLLGLEAELHRHLVVKFPEHDGEFAGPPASDEAALAALERLPAAGVTHLALAWPAFWWLEEYPRFAAALRARRVLCEEQDVVIFGPAQS
jgi:hypothetical protein